LSVKQVRQIEEGGMTAFYSETVKLTAARKVAGLLSLPEAELFGQASPQSDPPLADAPDDGLEQDVSLIGPSVQSRFGGELSTQHAPITRSEALHVLAQPPEHLEEETAVTAAPEGQSGLDATAAITPVQSATEEPQVMAHGPKASAPVPLLDTSSPSAESAPKEVVEPQGSGYLLKILALFVVALAAAALLKPKTVQDNPVNPPGAETAAEPPAAPVPPVESIGYSEPAPSPEVKPDSTPKAAGTGN